MKFINGLILLHVRTLLVFVSLILIFLMTDTDRSMNAILMTLGAVLVLLFMIILTIFILYKIGKRKENALTFDEWSSRVGEGRERPSRVLTLVTLLVIWGLSYLVFAPPSVIGFLVRIFYVFVTSMFAYSYFLEEFSEEHGLKR